MDKLQDTISNLSMYDVKAYVRKAQNVVLNYTEMEAKVREATNNEPWGASSTLMQEIAYGTNSYSQFHEIMPMIYKRFTEKTAEEWRQIYKALQLLEFLVKNGSERVVDYARSHSAVIDMLKHFHYIDHNGKDQGINIRNRAKELTILLSDVDKIRAERKKARANKSKYAGIGNDAMGFGGTGSRYGGFGSEFGGGYAGGTFGDGGFNGPGSSRHGGYDIHDDDDDFEEYQVEGIPTVGDSRSAVTNSSKPTPPPPKKAEPIPDFISFDDDEPTPQVPPKNNTSTQPAQTAAANDDDDFDDFQSATPEPSSATSSSKPVQSNQDITSLFSMNTAPQQPAPQPQQTTLPNFNAGSNTNMASASTFKSGPGPVIHPQSSSSTTSSAAAGSSAPAAKKDDAFGSLWTSASNKSTKKPANSGSLQTLAQQNAKDNMWGGSSSTPMNQQQQQQQQSSNTGSSSQIDDLLI